MNTAEFLMIASSVVPDRVAMTCGGKTRTFAEMQERVNRLANALQAMGVGKGDKVSVMALNSMEYVEIYYAGAKLGAVFVPLNYRAKSEELAYMCNNSETKVLFVGERYLELAEKIKPELETVAHTICIDGHPDGIPNYEDLLSQHEPEEILTDVDHRPAPPFPADRHPGGRPQPLRVERERRRDPGPEAGGDSGNPAADYFARVAAHPHADREALLACLKAPLRLLTAEECAKVTLPVLVVIGDRDFTGPGDPLAEALPDARLVVLRGADHFSTPKDFGAIDAALRFLED